MNYLDVEYLSENNCTPKDFAELLSLISEVKAEQAKQRLRESQEVQKMLFTGHALPDLSKRWLLYMGIFVKWQLVAIGALKFYPAGVKIWVKEENGAILPFASRELGLFAQPLRGDGLHLMALPAYMEFGNTAVLPNERGKGWHKLLHRQRLELLGDLRAWFPQLPSNLYIAATGALEMSEFNRNLNFQTLTFLPKKDVPAEIWRRLGEVRPESDAVPHLAKKMGMKEIGFVKSSGGPAFWIDNLNPQEVLKCLK